MSFDEVNITAVITYKLINFSSFIGVAVGLNLLFSFWESLRSMAISKFNKASDEMDDELKALLREDYDEARCVSELKGKLQFHLKNLNALKRFAKWIGVFITAILLCSLIWIGFEPELKCEAWELIVLIIVAVVISPVLLFTGEVYVYIATSKLNDFKNTHIRAIQDYRDLVVDTEKSNPQKAA